MPSITSEMDGVTDVPKNSFNQTPIFSNEIEIDEKEFFKWIHNNWTLSFAYSAVYVVLIFSGKYYMRSRPPFQLRLALTIWSAVLGIFSILGAARTLPEMIFTLRNYGWEYSVCHPSFYVGSSKFWVIMFTISKVYELGDTVFIVLRKQNLIFLHWYHHITVLIYTWYTHAYFLAPARWFVVMNYSVHAVMYSYYTLKAMRYRLPKFISMVITILQITQVCIFYIKSTFTARSNQLTVRKQTSKHFFKVPHFLAHHRL